MKVGPRVARVSHLMKTFSAGSYSFSHGSNVLGVFQKFSNSKSSGATSLIVATSSAVGMPFKFTDVEDILCEYASEFFCSSRSLPSSSKYLIIFVAASCELSAADKFS